MIFYKGAEVRDIVQQNTYSSITARGTLADRFILRGTKVAPLCRLLPTCYSIFVTSSQN